MASPAPHTAHAGQAPATRRDVAIAALLLLLAGFVDAIAFVVLGGQFVSFMSGNSTTMSASIAAGRWGTVALTGTLVAAFFAGAVLGAVIFHRSDAVHAQPRVLICVLAILLLGSTIATGPSVTAGMLVVAVGMGAVNAVLMSSPVGGSLTYVTGTLVKTAQALVLGLAAGDPWRWARMLWRWIIFCAGGVAGGLAQRGAGTAALWGGVVLTAVTLVVDIATSRASSR